MKYIKSFFSDAKEGLFVLFYAFKDKRTPLYAKALIVMSAVYLVSPLDLIPDSFFPFGFLDDFAIVPALFYFVYKTLPAEVLGHAKEKSRKTGKTVNRSLVVLFLAAASALIFFLVFLYFIYKLIFK